VPVYKKVNKDFFKKWTPEMAYVLGFFAADGYITLNKRGANFWCIQITDRALLEAIKRVVQAEHKIGMRLRKKETEKTIYRLQIGSKKMCDDLRELGFTERKTKSLAIPNIPLRYFSDFVRGYFDGDGNVWVGFINTKRPKPLLAIRVMFTSSSYEFLSKLKKRLDKFSIKGGKVIKGQGNYFRLQYSILSSLKLYDFMYNHKVKNRTNLFLDRKKKVFEKYIEMRL
jgi:hypothetical protein